MGWRCRRIFNRLGPILEQAMADLNANPNPSDSEMMSLDLANAKALTTIARRLPPNAALGSQGSECGRRLREIASVIAEWRRSSASLLEEIPNDPERRIRKRMEIERDMLATIAWLYIGKTRDEIRSEQR
jgi:hypothetical protein